MVKEGEKIEMKKNGKRKRKRINEKMEKAGEKGEMKQNDKRRIKK